MAKAKKREDGRLQRSITVGRNPDGSLKRKVIYARTQKELDVKASALIQQIQSGALPTNENVTFGEMADLLCKRFKPTVSEGVRKHYAHTCKTHFAELMPLRVRDIKASHLQMIINRLAEEGYATKTMAEFKQIASQVMRLAMDNDIVMRNVFEKVKVPTVEATKREPLTEQQMQLVGENYMNHRMGIPVMLMLYAGLRRGELLALQWQDIDFTNRVIHVDKALAFEAQNVGHIKDPKTEAGKRDVPLLDNLHDALIEAKTVSTSAYVCPSTEGLLMTNTAWNRAWNSYMHFLNLAAGGRDRSRSNPKVVAMEPFTAHQLRHTFISLCHEAGLDAKVTQTIAGHASISTTLNIYTHLTKLKKEESVLQLNEHIKKREQKKKDLGLDC